MLSCCSYLESDLRGVRVRERVLLSPDSHVDTPVQVRHCLGMQPTMQAHSAPADCVSRDVSDLWHSANRPSLIYMALLALRPTPVPANIRQRAPRAEPEPRCSQPQGFFTSALTAWPPLLPAIITGFLWAGLKNCFLPVSRLLCCEQ